MLLCPFCRCRHWGLDWLSGVATGTWVGSREVRTQARVCWTTMLLLLITGSPAQTEKFLRRFCLIWTIRRVWILVSPCLLRGEKGGVEMGLGIQVTPGQRLQGVCVSRQCWGSVLLWAWWVSCPEGHGYSVCPSFRLVPQPERIGFPVSLDGNPGCPISGGTGWEDHFLCHLSRLALTLTLSQNSHEKDKWSVAWRLRCHVCGALGRN